MPGLRKAAISEVIVASLSTAGFEVESASFNGLDGDLPWVCQGRMKNGLSRTFCMYFWTVGHGGKTRSNSEYRIQTKLKRISPFKFGAGTTLLLGYYDVKHDAYVRTEGAAPPVDMKVFAAWDPVKHMRPGASSSCQVPFHTMLDGFISGFGAFTRRLSDGTDEVVVAFRPEYLAGYLLVAGRGHDRITIADIEAAIEAGAR